MILKIIFWACTSITFGCLLFAIGFLAKIQNWKMRGYNGTFKALMKGTIRKVENPSEMTFISIENKMYHIGAWKAYRDFRNIFNDDDGEY